MPETTTTAVTSTVPNKYLWHNAMDNFIKTTTLKNGAVRDGRVGRRPMTIFCQDEMKINAKMDQEVKVVDVPSLLEVSNLLN